MQKKLTRIFLKKGFKNFKNIIPFIVLCFGAVIFVSSCKQNAVQPSTDYISKIDHESIVLADGSSISIEPEDRIYYLVRHAEKDTTAGDPDLTPIGYDRADELARLFRSARVDEVYSTMYLRTLMTADSISKSKGMSMKTYDPKSLKEFAERIKNIEDQKRFLIVGHSNTTPALSNHIHGTTVLEDFEEKDYDNLIVVVQGENKDSQLHQLKFKP